MVQQFPATALSAAVFLNAIETVVAQNGDGGGVSGNVPGSNPNAGNGGPSQSSANLSTGATVAIAVIVAIAVFIGVSTTYLFWSAKKRQWTVRDQLRHSRKRVTTGLKAIAAPITPGRGILSPVKTRFTTKETSGLREDSSPAPHSRTLRNFSRKTRIPSEDDTVALRDRDVEKGETVVTTNKASSGGDLSDKRRAKKEDMKISLPAKHTVTVDSPQTPVWNKFLGRT